MAIRLISWNVNGLRACLTKGFEASFQKLDADIFCLQETKMQQGQAELALSGYQEIWNSAEKKGYSGTAVFTRRNSLKYSLGIELPEHDKEGRLITVEYEDFFLVNVYTPNAQRELARLDYRMQWEDAFRDYLLRLDRDKPVIVCGDLNVAHKEIDLKHPKSNVKNAGFTPQEREKMTKLLESGFVDTFRYLYPEKTDSYTWWSYMRNARANNAGWRIDYFLISQRLSDRILNVHIHDQIFGSDHCPIELEVDL